MMRKFGLASLLAFWVVCTGACFRTSPPEGEMPRGGSNPPTVGKTENPQDSRSASVKAEMREINRKLNVGEEVTLNIRKPVVPLKVHLNVILPPDVKIVRDTDTMIYVTGTRLGRDFRFWVSTTLALEPAKKAGFSARNFLKTVSSDGFEDELRATKAAVSPKLLEFDNKAELNGYPVIKFCYLEGSDQTVHHAYSTIVGAWHFSVRYVYAGPRSAEHDAGLREFTRHLNWAGLTAFGFEDAVKSLQLANEGK